MLKRCSIIVIAIVLLFGFQSCNNDENTNINSTSRVRLKLVDAPGDYKEVNIEIVDILYNSSDDEEGWMSFTPASGYPIYVDLTELIAGNNLLLADEIIPSGMLKHIRLVLGDENTLVIEGIVDDETVDLDTPSAQQSGLKIKLDTELEPSFSYTFILDWDVQRSIVRAGNSGRYNLKPVIRAIAEVNSGSLQGKVINQEETTPIQDVLVQVVTIDGTLVAESLTDENGSFMIHGLSEGDYKIKIVEDEYEVYESPSPIIIVVGEVNDIGTIELIPIS